MATETKNQNPVISYTFLKKHPEGIVLTDSLRKQIAMAIKEKALPISIEGETGTGKEQIVKYIHKQLDPHGTMPLVILNCANLNKELAAASLFGHKKGAFTGAIDNSTGAIGKAHQGILFLDEFHRLESSIQEQILRTMQDGSYQRIGDHAEYFSNFRLIIATPKSPEQHAMEGQILMDLRFRLYGIEIKIPPLRHRLDQMSDFIDCFVANSDRAIDLSASQRQSLIDRCREFYWQGNIRQLFAVLRMLVVHAAAEDKAIDAADLPVYPTMLPPFDAQANTVRHLTRVSTAMEQSNPWGDSQAQQLVDLVQTYAIHPTAYEDFIDTFEKVLLTNLASQFRSVKSMCEALNLPRSTLHAKKQRLGLNCSSKGF